MWRVLCQDTKRCVEIVWWIFKFQSVKLQSHGLCGTLGCRKLIDGKRIV